MRRLALLLAVLVSSGAQVPGARAQDASPLLRPPRDVDVTYMMASPLAGGGWEMLTERQRWSVATGRLRIDPPTPGLWMVVDLARGQVANVEPAKKRVLEGPAPALPGASSGRGIRRGPDRVDRWPCTDWELRDAAGAPVVLCLTDDGVLLRASSGGQVRLEALELRYAPQPAALFEIPGDYRREPAPVVSATGQPAAAK